MGKKIAPINNPKEHKRIKIRVEKYLKYILKAKKTPASIESTLLFIEGERQRAVDDYIAARPGSYKRPTRLQYLKLALWR